MCIIGWIIVGALAGLITTLTIRRRDRNAWVVNMVVGMVGAVIGGWIWSRSTGGELMVSLTVGTILNAVLGAMLLLLIWSLAAGRSTPRPNGS